MLPTLPFSAANCLPTFNYAALLCRQLIFVVLAVFCITKPSVAEDLSARESQIRTAYLYHFAKFTEWPSAPSVFHYCVYEDTDFARLLQQSYLDKTIGKASIEVKNINSQSKPDDCQIIYFAQAAPPALLNAIKKQAILSIGTQKDFTELGGIIYLFEDEQKLRFYVNNAAATDAGLKINSQLLQLSKEP